MKQARKARYKPEIYVKKKIQILQRIRSALILYRTLHWIHIMFPTEEILPNTNETKQNPVLKTAYLSKIKIQIKQNLDPKTHPKIKQKLVTGQKIISKGEHKKKKPKVMK